MSVSFPCIHLSLPFLFVNARSTTRSTTILFINVCMKSGQYLIQHCRLSPYFLFWSSTQYYLISRKYDITYWTKILQTKFFNFVMNIFVWLIFFPKLCLSVINVFAVFWTKNNFAFWHFITIEIPDNTKSVLIDDFSDWSFLYLKKFLNLKWHPTVP